MLVFQPSTSEKLIYVNHDKQNFVATLRFYDSVWGLYDIGSCFCLSTNNLRQIADKLDEFNNGV